MPENDSQTDLRRQFDTLRLCDMAGRESSLGEIAKQIAKGTHAESCSIFLTNTPDAIVLAATTYSRMAGWIGKAAYEPGQGLTGWVFKQGKELHLQDIQSRDELAQYHGLMWMQKYSDTAGHGAWAAAPILAGSHVLGVVRISPRGSDVGEAEVDTLRHFCSHIASELIRVENLPTRAWLAEELYSPAEIRIEILHRINERVMTHLAAQPEDLFKLKHRMFEELIAELLTSEGWRTELTLPTHDGGYDIRASRSDEHIGEVLLLVEAQKYRADRPVSVDILRSLYAVKQTKHATKAMVATTSYVSRGAKIAFNDLMFELDIREYYDIASWLQKHYMKVNQGMS